MQLNPALGNVFSALPGIVGVVQGGKRREHNAMYVKVTSERESGALSHCRTEILNSGPVRAVIVWRSGIGAAVSLPSDA